MSKKQDLPEPDLLKYSVTHDHNKKNNDPVILPERKKPKFLED